jgi:hypothetical protein
LRRRQWLTTAWTPDAPTRGQSLKSSLVKPLQRRAKLAKFLFPMRAHLQTKQKRQRRHRKSAWGTGERESTEQEFSATREEGKTWSALPILSKPSTPQFACFSLCAKTIYIFESSNQTRLKRAASNTPTRAHTETCPARLRSVRLVQCVASFPIARSVTSKQPVSRSVWRFGQPPATAASPASRTWVHPNMSRCASKGQLRPKS